MSRPKIDIGKFREKWLATKNIQESLIAAGASPKSAARGIAACNKKIKAIVEGKEKIQPPDEEVDALIERLKGSSEGVADYIRGKIIRAVELGESPKNLEGHLKLLGTFKEHNIFDAKKGNEHFVLAPSEAAIDALDDWDAQSVFEENGGKLILEPTDENGVYKAQDGTLVKVKILARKN